MAAAWRDAATVEIVAARFDDFWVKKSTSDSFMEIKKGTASGIVRPRLAQAASSGACAVVTPNVTFEGLSLSGAVAHITTPDRDFDVDIKSSNLNAVNGAFSGHVDLGDLGVADRWADLAIATLSLDWNFPTAGQRGFQEVLLDAYGVTSDIDRIEYYRRAWDEENPTAG